MMSIKHHFCGVAGLTKQLIIFYTVCFSPLCCISVLLTTGGVLLKRQVSDLVPRHSGSAHQRGSAP